MLRRLNAIPSLFLVPGLAVVPARSAPLVDLDPRVDTSFDTHWLYVAHDVADGERPDLNDAGFEHVFVPHANIITPAETYDPDSFRFVSWYRKHFRPEDSWRGKLASARFQGVMTVADVYLNGNHLATHEGAYTPFDVDLTPSCRMVSGAQSREDEGISTPQSRNCESNSGKSGQEGVSVDIRTHLCSEQSLALASRMHVCR